VSSSIVAHLRDRDARHSALALLLRQKYIQHTLTKALVDVVRIQVEGLLCLIRIVSRLDWVLLVLETPNWIASRLPTFEHTLRLFLTVYFHVQLCVRLAAHPETPTLFVRLCTEGHLVPVSSLYRNGDIPWEFVVGLTKEGFFALVVWTVVEWSDEAIGMFAQVVACEEYGRMLPAVPASRCCDWSAHGRIWTLGLDRIARLT
jgi:hypothetical protein